MKQTLISRRKGGKSASTAGFPTQLAITTQPAGAVNIIPFTTQPVIEVRDASGALATTAQMAIYVTIATGTGAVAGTVVINAVNGVATFTNLQIVGSGNHSITFSSPGLTSVTSSVFSVGAGSSPTQLAITTQPAGAADGVNFTTQPVVQVRDAGGSLVAGSTAAVTAALASGTGTLSGTTTVNAVAGVATFTNLKIVGTGNHTITFTSSGLTSATSSTVNVTAGTATQLAITTQPAGAVDNVAFTAQPVIEIRTAGGVRVSNSTVSVTAALASGSGTLSGTTTVSAVGGVATFTNLKIVGTGNHTITFTSSGLTSATSSTISVAAAGSFPSPVLTPAGGTTLTTRNWNSLATSESDSAHSEGWRAAGEGQLGGLNMEIISDATAPLSPNNVLQVPYNAGLGDGGSPIYPGAQYDAALQAGNYKGIYIRRVFKPSAAFQSQGGINKFGFIWNGGAGPDSNDFYFNMTDTPGSTSGTLSVDFHTQNRFGGARAWFPTTGGGAEDIARGQWHLIEVYVHFESAVGASDAVIKVAINGVLIIDVTDERLLKTGEGSLKFTMFTNDATWGGEDGQVAATDFFTYEDQTVIIGVA